MPNGRSGVTKNLFYLNVNWMRLHSVMFEFVSFRMILNQALVFRRAMQTLLPVETNVTAYCSITKHKLTLTNKLFYRSDCVVLERDRIVQVHARTSGTLESIGQRAI